MTLNQDTAIYSVHALLETLLNTDDAEYELSNIHLEGLLTELEDAFPDLELSHIPIGVEGIMRLEDDEIGDGMTDAEADANALASIGWGTSEDYDVFED